MASRAFHSGIRDDRRHTQPNKSSRFQASGMIAGTIRPTYTQLSYPTALLAIPFWDLLFFLVTFEILQETLTSSVRIRGAVGNGTTRGNVKGF